MTRSADDNSMPQTQLRARVTQLSASSQTFELNWNENWSSNRKSSKDESATGCSNTVNISSVCKGNRIKMIRASYRTIYVVHGQRQKNYKCGSKKTREQEGTSHVKFSEILAPENPKNLKSTYLQIQQECEKSQSGDLAEPSLHVFRSVIDCSNWANVDCQDHLQANENLDYLQQVHSNETVASVVLRIEAKSINLSSHQPHFQRLNVTGPTLTDTDLNGRLTLTTMLCMNSDHSPLQEGVAASISAARKKKIHRNKLHQDAEYLAVEMRYKQIPKNNTLKNIKKAFLRFVMRSHERVFSAKCSTLGLDWQLIRRVICPEIKRDHQHNKNIRFLMKDVRVAPLFIEFLTHSDQYWFSHSSLINPESCRQMVDLLIDIAKNINHIDVIHQYDK